MKTKIMLENLGLNIRVTLVEKQGVIAENLFENLRWICHTSRVEGESFVCERERFARAIKCFRVANIHQTRRGRGLWKQSPFEFSVVTIRGTNRFDIVAHSMGEYQDVSNNPFEGYQARLGKHFDSVSKLEKQLEKI